MISQPPPIAPQSDIEISPAGDKYISEFVHVPQPDLSLNEANFRLYLMDFEECVKSKYDWVAYAGICLTLVVTLTTSNTKSVFGVPASVWQAVYIVLAIVTAGLTAKKIVFRKKFKSVDDVIQNIKSASVPIQGIGKLRRKPDAHAAVPNA